MFLTRLPVYRWVQYDEQLARGIARWFPLVGAVVGLLQVALLWACSQMLPWWPAIVLSSGLAILLTGAFHEDGFADMCDAFGGGWDKAQVLLIMKDSRLGTYGTLGLVLMLAGKLSALAAMDFASAAVALLAAHMLGRALSTSLLLSLPYVQDTPDPARVKTPALPFRGRDLAFMAVTLLPMLLLLPWTTLLAILPGLLALRVWAVWYFRQRIGGYTGDCLGGAEQLGELLVLLTCLAMAG